MGQSSYSGSGRVRVLTERLWHEAVRGRVDSVGDNAARQRVLKDARRQETVGRRDDEQRVSALSV